jgi:hypothetical protein
VRTKFTRLASSSSSAPHVLLSMAMGKEQGLRWGRARPPLRVPGPRHTRRGRWAAPAGGRAATAGCRAPSRSAATVAPRAGRARTQGWGPCRHGPVGRVCWAAQPQAARLPPWRHGQGGRAHRAGGRAAMDQWGECVGLHR